eukprot:scaffold65942_cov48-Phaeocystis_antarctica.AAC.2
MTCSRRRCRAGPCARRAARARGRLARGRRSTGSSRLRSRAAPLPRAPGARSRSRATHSP